jgi:hypothetical protein
MPDGLIDGSASQKGPHPDVELFDVYDLDGKLHRMSAANVSDVTRHLKWRTEPPIFVSVPAADANAAPPAPAAPVVAPEAPKVVEEPVKAPVDLTSMSREGLARFAKEKFGLDVDVNWSHGQILDAIQVELGQ